MARSTISMKEAAWVGVILSGLGVGLLWITVGHTAAAARYAKEAAEAGKAAADQATRTNDIAKESLSVQSRPWLRFDIEVNGPVEFLKDRVNYPLKVEIENIGAKIGRASCRERLCQYV